VDRPNPHLPRPALIEAYGNGGFRFGDMSHRGSLLCLPAGIWASPIVGTADITAEALDLVWSSEPRPELVLIGAGREPWILPADLKAQFREAAISVDCMTTGAAVRTYNILLGEQRRVGALLVAV
jgi:uncharacterized protein